MDGQTQQMADLQAQFNIQSSELEQWKSSVKTIRQELEQKHREEVGCVARFQNIETEILVHVGGMLIE